MFYRSMFLGCSVWATLTSAALSAATWTGAGGNANWTNANNWDPAVVPNAATEVLIDSGAVSWSGDFNRDAVMTITGNGSLTITSGRFQNANGGLAVTNISGNGSLTQTGNYFLVGMNYAGEVNQSGGTVTSNVDRGWFLSDRTGSQGIYNLTGGTLNVNLSGSTNHVLMGLQSGDDLFYVNGGAANFTATPTNRRVYIHRDATIQIDSGELNFSQFQYFVIGRDYAGDAKMLINGGETNIHTTTGFMIGGPNIGVGSGSLIITDGLLNVSGSGMVVGDGSTGIVLQSGGELVLDGVALTLAGGGSYTMNGGVLSADEILRTGTDPLTQFVFNNGLIALTGDQTSLLDQAWFVASPYAVANYNAFSDTTTFEVVPEPSSLALLGGAGLLTALAWRRPRGSRPSVVRAC